MKKNLHGKKFTEGNNVETAKTRQLITQDSDIDKVE